MNAALKVVGATGPTPQAPALRDRRGKMAHAVVQLERTLEEAQARYSRAIADALDDPQVDVATPRAERDRHAGALEDARESLRHLEERLAQAEAADRAAAHAAVRDEIARRSADALKRAEALQALLLAAHAGLGLLDAELHEAFNLSRPSMDGANVVDRQTRDEIGFVTADVLNGAFASQIVDRVRRLCEKL